MLEARDVRKVYRSGGTSLAVLQGVSLRVERGVFIAITGPSGAGKSTLLHLLAGLDTPTAGEVFWDRQPLSRMSETERAIFRNQTVGVVFQFYHLLSELTALENVMLPGLVRLPARRRSAGQVGGLRSRQALRERALHCLAQVGLSHRTHHKPNALSGGELQRAAIARALVNEPQLVLCDEPTGNLDSKTGAEVADLLVGLHREQRVSLVLVTHETSLAELADQAFVLRDGRIVEEKISQISKK